MAYWLMKTEPTTYSIDDLKKQGKTGWDGVRNYQARNFMRDDFAIGDWVLFYHSNARPPGVAGIAKVSRQAYADKTALDPKSPYYDPKATADNPIWCQVDVSFVEKFPQIISIDQLRSIPELKNMLLLKKGQRLSIQPVTKQEFTLICNLSKTL